MARTVLGWLHEGANKVITLKTGVGSIERIDYGSQHLHELEARTAHGEAENVFASLERVASGQTFDVPGTIEEAFALGLHQARIVLLPTLQACAIRHRGKRAPIR